MLNAGPYCDDRDLTCWPGRVLLALVLGSSPMAHGMEVTTDPEPREGRAAERVVSDGASVVLVVSGEQRGVVGACGCDSRPLGGLARQEAFVQALEAAKQPVLVLNAGGWMDASASGVDVLPRAHRANEDYLRALRRVRVDVLNAGWTEFASLQGRARPGLVSTSLAGPLPAVEGSVQTVGKVRVAVTGVTRAGMPYLMPPETRSRDAVLAVEAWAETIDADLHVVLVHDDPAVARDVALIPGVDIVVDAARYNGRWAPFLDGAVHVRTWDQGMRLAELRVWLGEQGVDRVNVRDIDLDAEIGEAWRGLPPRLVAEDREQR